MDIAQLSYNELTAKALMLLDDDNKVRQFLKEAIRSLYVLSKSDALSKKEQRALLVNCLKFAWCYNFTANINRVNAMKIYARFTGCYCEGLERSTALTLAMLFDELAESISHNESKEEQIEILEGCINYLYKE